MKAELSTSNVQCVFFVLVDGDLEDDMLRLGAVALVTVWFDNNDTTQVVDLVWLVRYKSNHTVPLCNEKST